MTTFCPNGPLSVMSSTTVAVPCRELGIPIGNFPYSIETWDWQQGKQISRSTATISQSTMSLRMPDGRVLTTWGKTFSVKSEGAASSGQACSFPGTQDVIGVAVARDGSFVTLDDASGVCIWRNGKCVTRIRTHFSIDSSHLIMSRYQPVAIVGPRVVTLSGVRMCLVVIEASEQA